MPPGETNISKVLTVLFICIRALLFESWFAGPVSSPIHLWRYYNKHTRYWSQKLPLIEYLVVKQFPKIFFEWLLMLRKLFNLALTFLINIFITSITIHCHLFLQRTESSLIIGNKPIEILQSTYIVGIGFLSPVFCEIPYFAYRPFSTCNFIKKQSTAHEKRSSREKLCSFFPSELLKQYFKWEI